MQISNRNGEIPHSDTHNIFKIRKYERVVMVLLEIIKDNNSVNFNV